jgi:phosphohistidine phosphatase
VQNRLLYLLRHGKSNWDDSSLDDHDRPLAPRGTRATKLIAEHLRATGTSPYLVLCSTARRAEETLMGITPALHPQTAPQLERELYGATADELLARLRAVPDDVGSVMMIGHNPGLEDLVVGLAGSGADLERVKTKFPTCALATLSISSWPSLDWGGAEIVDYVVPADLKR